MNKDKEYIFTDLLRGEKGAKIHELDRLVVPIICCVIVWNLPHCASVFSLVKSQIIIINQSHRVALKSK